MQVSNCVMKSVLFPVFTIAKWMSCLAYTWIFRSTSGPTSIFHFVSLTFYAITITALKFWREYLDLLWMYVLWYTHNIVSAKLKRLNWGRPYPRFFWPSIQSQRVIHCEGWRLLYLTGRERPEVWVKGKARETSRVVMNITISWSTPMMTCLSSFPVLFLLKIPKVTTNRIFTKPWRKKWLLNRLLIMASRHTSTWPST